MGEINYKHRKNSADEIEYLNEGKGCAVWSGILVLVILIGVGMLIYSTWEK